MRLLLPLTLIVAMFALVACGGDDNGGGGGDTGGTAVSDDADVQTILKNTFSGENQKVDSGVLALNVDLDASGSGSGTISLSGPFQSRGEKELPLVDMDLDADFMGQAVKAGATITEDAGFVALQLPGEGEVSEYEIAPEAFSQLEQAAAQSQQQADEGLSPAALGIDPSAWLTDPQKSDSDVEGTETVRITGGVDVPAMLQDVNKLLEKAGSLGVAGQAQLPSRLTDEQIAEAEKSLKDVNVEIDTGKDDSILRRMKIDLNAEDPSGSGESVTASIEYVLSEVNEDQSFEAPDNAKPFDELISKIGPLLGASGLGGGLTAP